MDNIPKPSKDGNETSVNPSVVLMYKMNADGIIEYVNHAYSEVSGFEEYEIIGETSHNLRHPDVPKVINNLLEERLEKKEPIRLVSKQKTKDGGYFWVLSDFESKMDDKSELVANFCHSIAAPPYAVREIDTLYKILSKIESKSDSGEVSKRYLIGFLEERNLNYNQFIEELSSVQPDYEEQFQKQRTSTEFKNEMQKSSRKHIPSPSLNRSKSGNTKKNIKKKSLMKIIFGK